MALGILKPQQIRLFLAQESAEIIAELITYFAKNKVIVQLNKKPPKREKSKNTIKLQICYLRKSLAEQHWAEVHTTVNLCNLRCIVKYLLYTQINFSSINTIYFASICWRSCWIYWSNS
jgi:hypothetical protein